MSKKKLIKGLSSQLLTRVRTEIVVIKTRIFGIEIYKVQGRDIPTFYSTDEKLARIIANNARLERAKATFRRKEERKPVFEKITKI